MSDNKIGKALLALYRYSDSKLPLNINKGSCIESDLFIFGDKFLFEHFNF